MNADQRRAHRKEILEHVGDLLENRIGSTIENGPLEAPLFDPEAGAETDSAANEDLSRESGVKNDRGEEASVRLPEKRVWYRIPVREGISGDGSGYHIYLKAGDSENLCIFFSGGGMAWNTYTAAHPASGGKMAAKAPNYYWNNLRPATQIMNINVGITDVLLTTNPFLNWNMIVVTYDTGDFHIGDTEYPYTDEAGEEKILHFHGWRNYQAAMEICRRFFKNPEKLLIAGDSAGAFAVPALSGDILDSWYPECRDVTLLSDSATLIYDGWREIIRNVWHAPEHFWDKIISDDPAGDWYEAFCRKYLRGKQSGAGASDQDESAGQTAEDRVAGRTVRCLYSSSTHDHLLSTYYNDLVNKVYETNEEMQGAYYQHLRAQMKRFREMMGDLQAPDGRPVFGMYIHQHKDLLRSRTGTVHTMVRHPAFLIPDRSGMSMAKWLSDAVDGNVYNVGEQLLNNER